MGLGNKNLKKGHAAYAGGPGAVGFSRAIGLHGSTLRPLLQQNMRPGKRGAGARGGVVGFWCPCLLIWARVCVAMSQGHSFITVLVPLPSW